MPNHPWDNEPNRKEWEHEGLKCVIIRHPKLGHLCGYVGLPATHPLHGLDYMQETPVLGIRAKYRMEEPIGESDGGIIPLFLAAVAAGGDEQRMATMEVALRVHGGVTYAHSDIYHYEGPPLWWVGFDCCHYRDFVPGLNRYGDDEAVYRDMEYVTEQTNRLAHQLVRVSGELPTEAQA